MAFSQRWGRPLLEICAAAGTLVVVAATPAAATTFTNPTSIAIPAATEAGPASPYPSTINVTGLPPGATVVSAQVTLNAVTLGRPDDVDVLLVGPAGQKTLLMSDTCGNGDLVGLNLTFADAAGSSLPDDTPSACTSGSYKPTDYFEGFDGFPAPAPTFPYPVALAVFSATAPNSAWQLYLNDDSSGGNTNNIGTIAGGWTLELLPAVSAGRPATVAAHVGGPGDDTLTGTPGPDVLIGLGGNDTITGLEGKDVVCGSEGADKLFGGSGNDLLRGEAGKDKLRGQGGKDTCKGGGASDSAKSCEKQGSI